MRKQLLLALALVLGMAAHAQLTGTKSIPGDYSSLKAAVQALNTQGVGAGGVTFELSGGYTETSADSIYITATGTAANPITFRTQGAPNALITRTGAGSLATTTIAAAGDAVIIVEGSDYITFDGIDVATANQGIEYGYLIRKASATDGAKNITIQNSTITMTRGTSAFVTGIGIINVLKGGSVTSATGVTVSSVAGRSENITLKTNSISNVAIGILARGYAAASPYDLYDQNLVIGGAAGEGNIIENFGGSNTAYGVYYERQKSVTASYNTLTSAGNGGAGAGAAVYGFYSTTSTTGTFNIDYNTIDLTTSAASSSVYGVYNGANGAGSINGNSISVNTTAASSGTFYYINNGVASAATTYNDNVFVGTTLNNTGTIYLIYNSNTFTAQHKAQNNSVSGLLKNTATAGTFYCYYDLASPTGVEEVSGNNFSNIEMGGTASWNGIYVNTTSGGTQNFFNNTISNITGGSGTSYAIYALSAGTRNIYGNKIFNITTSGSLYGINSGGGFTTGGIYKNKIYGLSALTASGVVYGITISGGTAPLVYNNIIGDLTAPAASGTDVIRGINITSTSSSTSIKVYFNTIYLNASSTGTNFGTSGVFHTGSTTATTATLDMRNNIIVNLSTASGTGITAAFRRTTTSIANYASTSNRNLFFAGAPSASNVIYNDGTNSDQTLAAYKTRVAPADAASVTENPLFVSTTGSNAAYLHINTSTPTRIEGGAAPITGVTDDFDGDARGTTPDIGADEFAGVPIADCNGTPTAGTITGSNNVCAGSGRTLNLSGQSNSLGISIEWRSSTTQGGPYTAIAGATSTSFNTGNLSTTTYYVAVVRCDNSGNTATTPEFAVTVNPQPTIAVTPANPTVCQGGNVSLTASGATSYVWSPATNLSATNTATVVATPAATRTYTVTGTDGNGCTNTASVTVNLAPAVVLAATATPATICANGTSQLSVSSTGRTYSGAAIAHAPVTATGTPTVLVNNGTATTALTSGTLDDGRWAALPVGFNFNFFGNNYTTFSVSTNGFMFFGNSTNTQGFNVEIPNAAEPNNVIHLVTADLDFRSPSTGRIEYFVEGTAPNRKLVVSFVNASFYDVTSTTTNVNPGNVTVQAVLYETTNEIEIHTTAITNTSVNKAQGIEDATGSMGYAVAGRNNTSTWTGAPNAIRYSYNAINYSWSPATFLNNTNTANPVASNVTATTTYTVTGTDAVSGCSGTTTVTLNAGTALAGTVAANASNVCQGTAVNLTSTITGGGQPYTYSWSNGSTVVSTSANFTANPTATTTYTLTVTDACGQSITANTTVTVNNPAVASTTPGTRCGAGAVTLSATGAPGTTLTWYTAASGGTAVGTGTSITPNVSATTTYYVAAANVANTATGGAPAPTGTSTTNLTNYGFEFTITKTIRLNTVDVVSTSGTSITIALYNAAGTTQLQTTGALTVPANATTAVPVNFVITPGTYRLVETAMTGSFIRDLSGYTYPMTLGTAGQINGYITTLTSAITTSGPYYYFYNWNFSEYCEGTRVPVIATVTTPPAITITAPAAVCTGQTNTISVSSPNSGYTYTWTPGNLTGASINVSPNTSTKYIVTATDNSGGASNGCFVKDSVTVAVNITPSAVSITSAGTIVCPNTTLALNASGGLVTNSAVSGTGTGVNGTTAYPSPLSNYYGGTKHQMLLRASELQAMGLNNTNKITSISFDVTAVGIDFTGSLQNFQIDMAQTTTNVLNSTAFLAAGTNVLPATTVPVAVGTVTIPFATPFAWDGTSNIVIQTSYSNNNSGTVNTTVQMRNTDAGFVSSNWYRADNASPNAILTAATPTSSSTLRPNLVIGYSSPATYTWSPATDLYTNAAGTTAYTAGSSATTVYAKPSAATTYTVTATGAGNCSVTGSVNLTVGAAPAITTQPAAQTTVCEGAPITLTVAATGTNLTYQWRKGSLTPVNIPGATSATFTIPSASASDFGIYTVVITGSCGTVTSQEALVTVNSTTTITTQPTDRTVCAGQSTTFTVGSTGTLRTFQWWKDNSAIAGATSDSYTVTNATAADAGSYFVVISGACGTATSNSATLTIGAAPVITLQPVSQTVCPGDQVALSVGATGTGLTYQWVKGNTDINGATTHTYSVASVTAADNGFYTVRITGTCGSVTSAIATIDVNAPTAVTLQPQGQDVCAGSSVTLNGAGTGTNLTYQWRKDGNPVNGATSASLTINNVSANDAGLYTLVITGACGSVTSNGALLNVNATTAITSQPVAQTGCPGTAATFTVAANGTALNYQWRKDGNPINGANAATYTIASVTAADAGTYTVVINGVCGDQTSNGAALVVNAANAWLGTVSNDWNNAANWCGGVPTGTSNVTIQAGTPFQPTIGGPASVNNLTIANGVVVTITANGTLDLYGNLAVGATGGLTTQGTLAFRGATQQTIPYLLANNVVLNGAGGVNMTDDVSVTGTLTLTNGNLTLNGGLLDVAAIAGGSASSKLITNGTGYVRTAPIGTTAVLVPVAPDAASYNPVTIANGDNKTYRVSVKTGINPAAAWPANAVNRTWFVSPLTTVSTPVSITLGYADADGGAAFNPAGNMEVGVHNGSWIITTPAGGVAAAGSATARTVTTTTTGVNFGAMAVGNVGSILLVTATPTLDADVTSLKLMPTIVNNSTVLRVQVRRTMGSDWVITDAAGRVVRTMKFNLATGTNDLRLTLADLASGVYFLHGQSAKGKLGTIRFVKQ